MSDRIIVYLPTGQLLSLDEPAFRAALEAGQAFAAPAPRDAARQQAEPLVDSAEMGRLLGVGATKVEALAAQRAIPSVRIGKNLRFDPREVLAAVKAGHADFRSADSIKPAAWSGSCTRDNHGATTPKRGGNGRL